MLVTESRPRTLRWTHAGPLLYGDWGTSRLYVLGLAFLYTAHASVIYLAAIGLLMLAVSWAYTIVCPKFPDGGGVYTAARQLNPTLSVIGATLLLSGYIMTAAISVIEAFHYFGAPEHLVLPLGIASIVLIGAINWFGAKSAGRFAFVVAFAALGVSAIVAVLCVPSFFEGVRTIEFDYFEHVSTTDVWVNFTKICLALAGVEAVANMTGLMKEPVEKEARKTIWPVTIEVVSLNMVFGLALTGLAFVVAGSPMSDIHKPDDLRLQDSRQAVIDTIPDQRRAEFDADHPVLTEQDLATLPPETAAAYESLTEHEEAVEQYTNAAMKVIAAEAGERALGESGRSILGTAAGIVFGLLLLSATNTAVMAMVSVLFSMGADHELPRVFTKLNYSGVPWVGLVAAVCIPIAVIAVEQDVTVLAKLYVLGVCGAITVTLLSTAVNKDLEIGPKARFCLWALGLFLASISLTIAITQWVSTAFSGGLIATVLTARTVMQKVRKPEDEDIPAPESGWLAELHQPPPEIDPQSPRIMLAARGRSQAEFAVDLARRRNAAVFAIFVRTLRVMDVAPSRFPKIEEDEQAQQTLGHTALLARKAGVPFFPIYIVSEDIVGEILDYTVTYNCDTLIMGKTQRSLIARRLEGDVVSRVAAGLPDEVALITRSAKTPHVSKRANRPPTSDES